MNGKTQVEAAITDLVARIAPWAAPVPTAYLVGWATVEYLRWPAWVGFVAAVIVESLGLATTATALELREYNASKRKSDPRAPFALAVVLVGVYFVVAVGLTVALDILPALATYAPGVFPVLSLGGVTVLALRSDHRRRLSAIEREKAERRASRKASRKVSRKRPASVQDGVQNVQDGVQELSRNCPASVQEVSGTVQDGVQNVQDGVQEVSGTVQEVSRLDAVNVSRRERKAAILDAMLDIYLDSPGAGATAVARQLGIGRSTVYGYLDELEQAGRVKRNGNGVEVLT